ncbi:DUF4384 domain-containing protein [bacterium]|nr:DUF4384 domain-containing protein [candidate division CSSED10-310 bacterium]
MRINPEHVLLDANGSRRFFDAVESISCDLEIRGAITEFDTKIGNLDKLEGDILFSKRGHEFDFGGDYSDEIKLTTMAIDLYLVDFKKSQALPGMAVSYKVQLIESDKSFDFGIMFEGSGLGFSSTTNLTQGRHLAVRTATQLALVRLLGEFFNVPWHRCAASSGNEKILLSYRRALETNPDYVNLYTLKLLLYAHGYNVDPFSVSLSYEESQVAYRVKESCGFKRKDSDLDFIARLWETIPIDSAEERMEVYRSNLKAILEKQVQTNGTDLTAGSSKTAESGKLPTRVAGDSRKPRQKSIDGIIPNHFQIKTEMKSNGSFHQGEKIEIFCTSPIPAYLSVIIHKNDGNSFFYFPNRYNQKTFVPAGKTVSILDRGRYVLRADSSLRNAIIQVVACTNQQALDRIIAQFRERRLEYKGSHFYPSFQKSDFISILERMRWDDAKWSNQTIQIKRILGR